MTDIEEIPPRPGFVGSAAAAERIKRMHAEHREAVDGILDEMHEADRIHAAALADIRKAARLTQTQLAAGMGISQSDVSRIERQPDLLLSTLANYLRQIGQDPRVVVTVDGHDIELHLLDRLAS